MPLVQRSLDLSFNPTINLYLLTNQGWVGQGYVCVEGVQSRISFYIPYLLMFSISKAQIMEESFIFCDKQLSNLIIVNFRDSDRYHQYRLFLDSTGVVTHKVGSMQHRRKHTVTWLNQFIIHGNHIHMYFLNIVVKSNFLFEITKFFKPCFIEEK